MSRAAVQNLLQDAQRLHQAGKLAEAEAAYRQVLQRAPDEPTATHLLGLLAHQTGRTGEAIDLLCRSVSDKRTPPEFRLDFARVLLAAADPAGALQQLDRAIENRSGYADAHAARCIALSRLGRFEDAVAAGDRARGYAPASIEARETLADALFRLASDYDARGRTREAVAAYRRYVDLRPTDPGGFVNLAANLQNDGKFEEAVAACDRALALHPGNVQAMVNRAAGLAGAGRTGDAIEAFRAAAAITTHDPATAHFVGMARSNLLLALHYEERGPQEIFDAHLTVGEIYRPLRRSFPAAAPRTDRRVRVGYVSPDFRLHAAAHFIEPILAAHDRAQFEVFCISNSTVTDEVTRRLQGYDVQWRDITPLSDEEAADLVVREGIDILVDLATHTGAYRLPMFAMKPAPVQVNYLGYPDTSGLTAMDYRITDAIADPPGATERYHVEQLVRLRTAWCYRPLDTAPAVGSLPHSSAGHVTFGSFNNRQKLTPPMLRLWARIVSNVPGARLVIKATGLDIAAQQRRIIDTLAAAGLSSDRVTVLGRTLSMEAHLDLYNRIDVALDTYPYHGTTTTCEAIWMGVPVVTLAGRTHASRVGASLLTTVGLPEHVANSEQRYAEIAAALANDVTRLKELRAGMRERMSGSPLMDAVGFTRELEAAYLEMVAHIRRAIAR